MEAPESNAGPARSQESAGASGSEVSGEESWILRGRKREGERAREWRESGTCSDVANAPTAAEVLQLVDAAIVALDAGETEVARAHLRALAATVRAQVTAARRDGV